MTTYTPPNVHRVNTRRGLARTADLGYVDRHGTYRFRDGRIIQSGGGSTSPDGTHLGGATVVVQPDGQLQYGYGPGDGADPAGTAARLKHHVDADFQGVYDADPDAFDANPLAVFTAADGA